MKKSVIILFVLFLFSHCAEYGIFEEGHKAEPPVQTSQEEPPYKIIMVKHPDWNFPATDPNSVVIYEGFMPLDDKFFTIAKIGTIEFGGLYDAEELKRELKLKAAEIGGHALILGDMKTYSTEVGGGIKAESFPQYFWWYYPGEGLKREYTGTEYYAFELPKQTITNYSRIYVVIKFDEKFNEERDLVVEKFIELYRRYPYADLKDVRSMSIGFLEQGVSTALTHDYEQDFKSSQAKFVDEIFKTYGKKYPLADRDEVVALLLERSYFDLSFLDDIPFKSPPVLTDEQMTALGVEEKRRLYEKNINLALKGSQLDPAFLKRARKIGTPKYTVEEAMIISHGHHVISPFFQRGRPTW